MNALLIGLIALIAIAVVLFMFGASKAKTGFMVFGFVVILAIALTMVVLNVSKTNTYEYRVVYVADDVVVVIDDKDGDTQRYNLKDITHADTSFQIGDQVVVVSSGLGKPVFIAPATQVAPEPDPETETGG